LRSQTLYLTANAEKESGDIQYERQLVLIYHHLKLSETRMEEHSIAKRKLIIPNYYSH